MELSEQTWAVIRKRFAPEEQEEASRLLADECGNNLPSLGELDKYRLERFRYAALKLSKGKMSGLRTAIAMAQHDWRDLLVAAQFANSLEEHKRWAAELLADPAAES